MLKNILLAIFLVAVVGVLGAVVYESLKEKPATPATSQSAVATDNPLTKIESINPDNMKHIVSIKTNYGDIEFATYDKDAPKAVNNFLILAEKGFYNKLIFHRVVKGFMIQAGDPYCIDPKKVGLCGSGGPGYQFMDELDPNTESYKAGYGKGVVAMANAGPNTNGSQFFIMLDYNNLPHNYTIFGKVLNGQEVVDKIGSLQTDANDRPTTPAIIERVSARTL